MPLKSRLSLNGNSSDSGHPRSLPPRKAVPERPAHVIGPVGEYLTLDALPAPDTPRWTPRRKAEVVAAVRGGLLTFDEACARYELAMEELINWQRAVGRSGIPGLRVTRLQQYREFYERQDRF